MLEAMVYLLRLGCPWRYLPADFPGWETVHHFFPPVDRHLSMSRDP